MGCTARIIEVLEKFDDGRSNILVRGIEPVVIEEVHDDRSYSTATASAAHRHGRPRVRGGRDRGAGSVRRAAARDRRRRGAAHAGPGALLRARRPGRLAGGDEAEPARGARREHPPAPRHPAAAGRLPRPGPGRRRPGASEAQRPGANGRRAGRRARHRRPEALTRHRSVRSVPRGKRGGVQLLRRSHLSQAPKRLTGLPPGTEYPIHNRGTKRSACGRGQTPDGAFLGSDPTHGTVTEGARIARSARFGPVRVRTMRVRCGFYCLTKVRQIASSAAAIRVVFCGLRSSPAT